MKKSIILLAAMFGIVPVAFAQNQEVVLDPQEFDTGVYSDPAELLRGRLSGIRVSSTTGAPGQVLNTNIRGLNTLRGTGEPLWIIDGAVLASSPCESIQPFWNYTDEAYAPKLSALSSLNLYEIESIEVIKDASALALYGNRGANGVIIIKTRRSSSENFSANVHTNVGVSIADVKGPGIKPGITHNHSVIVGSAKGHTEYSVSAFYKSFQGCTPIDNNSTAGLRVKLSAQAGPVVSLGINSSLSRNEINSSAATAWYGRPSEMLSLRDLKPLSYADPDKVTSIDGWNRDYDDKNVNFRTTNNFYVNFNFLPVLKWKNNLSFDFQSISRNIWYGNGTAFGKKYNGAAALVYQRLFDLDVKSSLEYNQKFANKFNLFVAGMFELVGDWDNSNTLNGTDFFIHEMRAKGLQYQESKALVRYFSNNYLSPSGTGIIKMDYDGIAGLDASIRYEANDRYDKGEIPVRESLYPSASAWFDIRKLAFPTSKAVSALKIEGGYGEAGAHYSIPYELMSMYTSGPIVKVDSDYQAFYEGYNRVRSTEAHVSLLASFLSDRIRAKVSAYHKKSADMLSLYCFGKPKDESSPLWVKAQRQTIHSHTSNISNKGVEVDMDFVAVKTGKTTLTFNVNAAWNKNSIDKLSDMDVDGLSLNQYGIRVSKNKVGDSVSSLYGFTLDKFNIVTGEEFLGETVPKVSGGIGANLKVGNFSLDLIADGAAGFKIFNLNRMVGSAGEDVAEAYVEKGDYLRLSRVTAGYELPLKAKWIRSVGFSLTGTNLLTLTGYSGWNPDVNSFGQTSFANGLDYGSHPLMRTIMFGVSAKF